MGCCSPVARATRRDRRTGSRPVAPAAIADGWRAVRRSATLSRALIIAFVGSVAQGLFLVLFVLFVLRSLHAGDSVVGLLRGVQAIGGVLITTCAKQVPARTLTVSGLAGFALLSLLTWNSPSLTAATWWYVALFIAVGAPGAALVTGLITATHQTTPSPLLGRVLSLIQVGEAVGQGVGILAAGLLSGLVSLTVLLNAQASCYVTCALIAITGFARTPRRAHKPSVGHEKVDGKAPISVATLCANASGRDRNG